MRRRRAGIVTAVVASGLVLPFGPAAAAGPAPAVVPTAAAPAAGGDRVVSSPARASASVKAAGRRVAGATVSDAAAISAYWTPARMRAAKPVEMSPGFAAAARRGTASAELAPIKDVGAPMLTPPSYGKAGVPKGVSALATNPNLPSNHLTARTSGKVFFTKLGGSDFVCSGTIVNTAGKDSVWTAGHCLHDGGEQGSYHLNWQFAPGYDDDLANPTPYGRWSANTLSTVAAWRNDKDYRMDLGVATMDTLGGEHIVSKLGGQGFASNRDRTQFVNGFGYPSGAPFDGGNLRQCAGTTSPRSPGSHDNKIPCDMTPGVSGGGWFIQYDGRAGRLNGVFSRVDDRDNPTIAISPYFGDDAAALFNATKNH
jgi:V8-like Glu-specific endopeptidase